MGRHGKKQNKSKQKALSGLTSKIGSQQFAVCIDRVLFKKIKSNSKYFVFRGILTASLGTGNKDPKIKNRVMKQEEK